MWYPANVEISLIVLVIGLFGSGSWPAVRQIINNVNYASFNVGFLSSMSVSGIGMLMILCQPSFAGDYAGLKDAVVQETTRTGTSLAIFMAILAGICVGSSNFLLAASMPMAGLTRSLPVFNGVAVIMGVGLNYLLEGNEHPTTLILGVSMVLLAIFLTFMSRTRETPCTPNIDDDSEHEAGLRRRHILSYQHLQSLVPSLSGNDLQAMGSESQLEKLPFADSMTESPGDVGDFFSFCFDCIPAGKVVRGLILCALSGAVDGCWSVFAAGATFRGLDHYVVCFYMSIGLLLPLVVCTGLIYMANPQNFVDEMRRLTLREFALTAVCGFLNMFGIVTYYAATANIASAVAFAIFLCTPLVSISIGVRCFRELEGESPAKHCIVMTILLLYMGAIVTISANALVGADTGE